MSPFADEVWKISSGSRLHYRKWQNEYVFYNAGSGDTHLLDAVSGEVLSYLEKNPSTVEQISAALGFPKDPARRDLLPQIIHHLRNASLIELELQ